ncbi:MAG TPA: DUF6279 family lipoprotein [Gammaproteobacteria bacterium]
MKSAMLQKPVISVLLCILLGACTTKLAYNYLDWIVEWYAEDLVTLNGDQDRLLENAIANEHTWHRQKQLPLYVKSLDELTDAINNGLTIEALQQLYNDQENALNELSRRVSPTLARLFTTLSDSQIAQLLENLEAQNRKLEADYVDKPIAKLVQQRAERVLDQIENRTGKLTEPQIQLITTWSWQIKFASRQWIANRRDWQAKLGEALTHYRHSSEFTALIEELVVNSDTAWPDSYRADFRNNLHLTMVMLVKLEKQLSERQRRHLLDNLAVLRKQLVELHHP